MKILTKSLVTGCDNVLLGYDRSATMKKSETFDIQCCHPRILESICFSSICDPPAAFSVICLSTAYFTAILYKNLVYLAKAIMKKNEDNQIFSRPKFHILRDVAL